MASNLQSLTLLVSFFIQPGSRAMLKVTINNHGDSVETWELEGKLSGEWVSELERCWRERDAHPSVRLQINLKTVSYIDAPGKELLKQMYGRGVEIKGCGCMIRAVVDEITRQLGSFYPHGSTE